MYLKLSLSLRDLDRILKEQSHLVRQSRAGNPYIPVNLAISSSFDANGNNIHLAAFQGRQGNGSQKKTDRTVFGNGRIDVQDLKKFVNQLSDQPDEYKY